MACIPVYKGKRFPSTKKLVEYLSTEEGVMAHLSDDSDPEFLQAIEDAMGQPTPTKSEIDEAAHQAATSPKNDLPEPTQAQKEAGNYQLGHVNIQGLDISIENPEGSERKGVDADGKEWSVKMKNHYGYIRGTEGADGDHVDVFIGPNPESDKVFVIDQVNQDGTLDEHKSMVGFDSEEEARKAYLSNYSKGWTGLGAITEMSMDDFKEWLKTEDSKKPVGDISVRDMDVPGKNTSPFAAFGTKGGETGRVDVIAQINGIGMQNPLNPKETIIDGVRVEMVPYEGKGVEIQSIESTNKGEGKGTRVLKKITDIADLNNTPVVVYPVQIEATTEDQLRKWYAKNGFVEQENGEMIYTPKKRTNDEKVRIFEDSFSPQTKAQKDRVAELIERGLTEREAIYSVKIQASKEFAKSLPPEPPTAIEIESQKNEADFKKMREETGAKRSNRTWGNNAMGEDMGYQINTDEDAAIFIKPYEEEIETEEGVETATTGTAIELVYVNPEKRGTGKAKQLIQKVVAAADKTGTTLHLDIAPQDKSTTADGLRKLYEGFGFEINEFGHGIRKPKQSPFTAFTLKGEAGRIARSELKEKVGKKDFADLERIHKNAEKILRSMPESFQIDCP